VELELVERGADPCRRLGTDRPPNLSDSCPQIDLRAIICLKTPSEVLQVLSEAAKYHPENLTVWNIWVMHTETDQFVQARRMLN